MVVCACLCFHLLSCRLRKKFSIVSQIGNFIELVGKIASGEQPGLLGVPDKSFESRFSCFGVLMPGAPVDGLISLNVSCTYVKYDTRGASHC